MTVADLVSRRQSMNQSSAGRALIDRWFSSQGWSPWPFQREAWDAYLAGKSGLIQVATGAGKTYAAFMGPLIEMIDLWHGHPGHASPGLPARAVAVGALHTLYITPLRAVTRDIEHALKRPIHDLHLPFKVESRTGDTSAATRARQRDRLPHVLLTTPESLSLLLTRDNARDLFAHLRCVIVDEWHELLTSKRGTMTELCLARLRAWNPALRTWGLSATLPNAHEALDVLCGLSQPFASPPSATGHSPPASASLPPLTTHNSPLAPTLIRADLDRPVEIKAVIPHDLSRLPWAGHLGLSMLEDVLRALDPAVPTIVFTNTRSQSERWFHAIAYARPDWAPLMALHHGSVEREDRERIEAGLKSGALRIVVATSSLDLGVDFAPIEKVLQIGSPKGVARIVQRAGRANHRVGGIGIVHCVPTHALELIEIAAARAAQQQGAVEPRYPYPRPLDVLAQHIVTCALGGGFRPDDLYREVTTAHSYRDLPREEFDWALSVVHEGGVLKAYPQFRRVAPDEHGVYRVPSKRIAQVHRLNVGTITGDATLEIRYLSGKRLGTIDEGFVAGLRTNEKFVFAGKVLRFVMIKDLTVLVRPAPGKTANTPIWAGTRLPISEPLSESIRRTLERAAHTSPEESEPELLAARPVIDAQQRISRIPAHDELLAETTRTREGCHLFLFPFEGRLVHAGLAALLALRLARRRSASFSISVGDYGLEILSATDYPFADLLDASLFTRDNLAQDVAHSVNMTQLARLAFRDVARVAGLVFQNHPGARKTGRQLQAGSSLVFDVLTDFDPGNLFLLQSRREVLDRHFEHSRLSRTLARLAASRLVHVNTPRLTPLSFPLVIERVATRFTNRTLRQRLESMRRQW